MKDKEFIIDDMGKEVLVDIKKFLNHINQFHSSGVSIHEERGHYFTVNDSFLLPVLQSILTVRSVYA